MHQAKRISFSLPTKFIRWSRQKRTPEDSSCTIATGFCTSIILSKFLNFTYSFRFKKAYPKIKTKQDYFDFLYITDQEFIETLTNYYTHLPLPANWDPSKPFDSALLAKNQESSLNPFQSYALKVIKRGWNDPRFTEPSEWKECVDSSVMYQDFIEVMAPKIKPTREKFIDEMKIALFAGEIKMMNLRNTTQVPWFSFKSSLDIVKNLFLAKFPAAKHLINADTQLVFGTVEEHERVQWLSKMTEDTILDEYIPARYRSKTDFDTVTFDCSRPVPCDDKEIFDSDSPAAIKRKQIDDDVQQRAKQRRANRTPLAPIDLNISAAQNNNSANPPKPVNTMAELSEMLPIPPITPRNEFKECMCRCFECQDSGKHNLADCADDCELYHPTCQKCAKYPCKCGKDEI